MKLKLAGHLSQGSGKVNEDAVGFIGAADDVTAAWALDGVTGINDTGLGVAGSDAQWFVSRIDHHLHDLLAQPQDLPGALSQLIDRLIEDMTTHRLPDNFDPPAACIAAICRIGTEWHSVRLGDCRILAEDRSGFRRLVDFPNDEFDHWVTTEATRLRQSGMTKLDDLFRALQPAHFASRRQRNKEGGYGVIEADRACLAFAEYLPLDQPSHVLLSTDGFFRLVDHYGEASESTLLARAAQQGGVSALYGRLRQIERGDPDCMNFPRLKPQDDASAIALIRA
ncbi:protein phosphatase 2C domain-containing protein [Taklimakanibacter lacteus]|uniref:protein phosphatase 2C domain-containing protein n=1 Tax=Taklimakanibacter lacteus TaxID=2268456 RepID=UPI000E670682